jgi:uncharacterized protein DUF6364
MTQLTLTLDESSVESAQRVAAERHTTLDHLVGEYFEHLASERSQRGRAVVELLEESFRVVSRPLGGKLWTNRDELYDL